VITTPAAFGSSAKILLTRRAIVNQLSSVMSGLPTLTICSTLTSAYCAISGTPATSSAPSSAPDRYSLSAVGDAPRPEMVPPVDSTQTIGRFPRAVCAAHGAAPAAASASAQCSIETGFIG